VARPKIHDENLRAALIEKTGQLLRQEGVGALSLRRLANDLGTSTTAVYSLFGGKPGLLSAVHVEAFRRFGAQLSATPVTADPHADLLALGHAYRAYALTHPNLYAVLFGGALPEFEPSPELSAEGDRSMLVLVDAVRRAMSAGVLEPDDPAEIAHAIWAGVHGEVSLELSGRGPERTAAQYDRSLRALLRGWAPQAGTDAGAVAS
jgi:AcrR family transcriptional regulator